MRLFLALCALLIAVPASAATTATRPKTMTSYCSPSGDICYGVVNRSGAVYYELTAAAQYFARYRLCRRALVGGAAGLWRCGGYPLIRHGSQWTSRVKFSGGVPAGGANFRVEWSQGGPPTKHKGGRLLGPALRFHLPARG